MSRMTIADLSKDISNLFSEEADNTAKSTGFVQRKSKLTGSLFFSALITACFSSKILTLESICSFLYPTMSITKQGMCQRFNKQAVDFLSSLFDKVRDRLRSQHPSCIDLLSKFSSVNLLDSSIIQLPESMSGHFKSFGGEKSKAALKLQVMYDYVKNQLLHFEITEARRNDQGYRGHLENIETGALYLQDLGYFCLESFKTIFSKKAFVISRLLCSTKVYDPATKEEVDLLKALGNKASDLFSFDACIGKKDRINVRLTCQRAPKAVAEKRRCDAKKVAKKKGYTPKKTTLALCDWSIYITNIPLDIADDKEIVLLYKVRWQIELLFKLCKSEAKIDKTLGELPNRIMCELYAKMIAIVLLLSFALLIPNDENTEISHSKMYSRLSAFASDFFKSLCSTYRIKKFITQLVEIWKKYAVKDPYRKKRKSTHQQLIDTNKPQVTP